MSEDANKPEWQVIGQLVSSIQVEQRRTRRWGIFFKSITFIFLFLQVFLSHQFDLNFESIIGRLVLKVMNVKTNGIK